MKSILIVEKRLAEFDVPLNLLSGSVLPCYEIVYETYGKLNAEKSNAVLICPSLFKQNHVTGCYSGDPKNIGWWGNMVGSGKPIDTDKFFVIGLENIGGCRGTTGPSSINSDTGLPYGENFPFITVEDWVNSQARLADKLGIKQFAAVVGCSYAGMQALQWSLIFPERVRHVCVIASTPHLTARNIAFHYLARKAILNDHNFNWNNFLKYGETDVKGLASSFMLEHISSISFEKLEETFGRELRNKLNFSFDIDFEIESFFEYIAYPAHYYDPSSYIFMSKAYDYFDLYKNFAGESNQCEGQVNPNYLVISFTSDWMFPPQRSKDVVDFLLRKHCAVTYEEIESEHGNSSYLMPIPRYHKVVGDYFMKLADD